MAGPSREAKERMERNAERARQRAIDAGDDPNEAVEDSMEYIDTENNPGELTIALDNIRRAMEKRGLSYDQAARLYGIRGHPHFKDFWPVTRYWGDARFARERLGLPLDGSDEE